MSEVGNKARNLQVLASAGFPVPPFIVLPPEYEHDQGRTREALEGFVDPDALYAVRSSGTREDTADLSFAGQYYTELNVRGIDGIVEAARRCYGSLASKTAVAYRKENRVPDAGLDMAVIVQEMIDPDYSGVAFSINPLSGGDKEIVIDVAEGLGDAVVSGHVAPEEYAYDWYDGKAVKAGSLLGEGLFRELADTVLRVQALFGYPVDVEFAIKDERIYLLQARAVTRVLYEGIPEEWTTADFKDGGVSAAVCTPFMWSLYEYVWEIAYRKFLTESLFLDGKGLGKLGDMFFGRPYWNLSKTKLAMSKVPGYKEREFDEDLGIRPAYDGEGTTTSLSPRSAVSAARILLKNNAQVKDRLKANQAAHDALIKKYDAYLRSVSADESAWQRLVFDDYLLSEGTYFEQIFINTIAQSIYKDRLLKHIPREAYLQLLMGLDDVSHMRPYRALWELSRKKGLFPSDMAGFLDEFGYHSDKELDVTYPHFAEEPEKIQALIGEIAKLPDEDDPAREGDRQRKAFNEALEKVPTGLQKDVAVLRSLLWWREEFRDVSTRFYYLIRLYTLALAKDYEQKGIIASVEDLWFLKVADLKAFMGHKLSPEELRAIIAKNRLYYDSFRNFTSANEIGRPFNAPAQAPAPAQATASSATLKGVGCSTGTVTGKARIVHDLSEIDRIQRGDILVTKFTDTGWTSKFAVLSGIITEYGGVLCHAAIVSREFGIPCVVCVENALSLIKDGEAITINGATGEITKGGA